VPVCTIVSFAVTVAAVYPVPDAVNVVVPVLLALAVTVTVCGVLKLDEVNVSVVGDAVSPVLPDAATVTVSVPVGAADSARVNVPVPLCCTFRLVGVALIVGLVTTVSATDTDADVTPVPEAVKTAVPLPLVLAVTVTVCAVLKFDGVKVRLVGEAVSPAVFPDEVMVTVVLADGAEESARVKVPVLP
jgi:hypothetical protein